MATYKVAQDVEADDKLLGPFGFRQFLYLIIVAMAGFIGYGLWQIMPPLALLPSPIILFFGALALPLRKDQPMETYLAAMVSFYLKPHKRLWKPDGVENIVEIVAPKTGDESLTKNFSGSEADRRLSYLADLADTRGWAIRHTAGPSGGTSMLGDVYIEAQTAEDILEESGNLAQNIDSLIGKADAARRQEIMASMQRQQTAPATPVIPQPAQQLYAPQPVMSTPAPQAYAGTPIQPPQTQQPSLTGYPAQPTPTAPDTVAANLQFNPYPSIHQTVIQPIAPQPVMAQPIATPPQPAQQQPASAAPKEESTSGTMPTPDIMNLANNSKNLSVETIAREANRLENGSDEVVISLR